MARVVQVQLLMSEDALKAVQVCGIDISQVAGDAVAKEIRDRCETMAALARIDKAVIASRVYPREPQ